MVEKGINKSPFGINYIYYENMDSKNYEFFVIEFTKIYNYFIYYFWVGLFKYTLFTFSEKDLIKKDKFLLNLI